MAKRPKRQKKSWFFRFVFWTLVIVLLAPVGLIAAYRYVPPPVTPLMVIRTYQGEGLRKDWVPLNRISPNAVRAVIALEDANFCKHTGFDWDEVKDALSDHLKGGRLRGASTISMQTAKNLFLWPGRDIARKAIEAPLTFLLEKLWTKRRILEVYLNVIEWGPGIYGIEAASRAYFKKSASRLTRREAGLLAAVLPNPRRWSPKRPTVYIEGRVQTAMARSAILGNQVRCTYAGRA